MVADVQIKQVSGISISGPDIVSILNVSYLCTDRYNYDAGAIK